MKHIATLALLFSAISLHAMDTSSTATTPTIDNTALADNAAPTLSTIGDDLSVLQKHIVTYFTIFMNNFVVLLSEKTEQAKVTLNQLLQAVIELSQGLSQNKKTMSLKEHDSTIFAVVDEHLLDTLSTVAIRQASMMSTFRKGLTSSQIDAKQRADVQKILNSFAGVMQSFFAIVQAPENKPNVAQGIMGMLGNIIAAGNVIINDTQAPVQTVEEVVSSMDENTKQQILNLLQSRSQSIRIHAE